MEQKPIDKLRDLLDSWPINVTQFEADPDISNIYHVAASTGERYILKNVGELRDTISPLVMQHRVTQYLHRSGIRLGYLLTTRSGGCYATDGVDAFTLMPRLEREQTNMFADDAGPIYYNIGRAYAHLHMVLAAYDGEIGTWRTNLYARLFEFSVPRMRKRHTGEKRDRLEAILSGLAGPIADVSPRLDEQPVLWDCHMGNTLVYNGQVSGFVDCDHFCLGPRICDLGNFAANLIVRNCTPNHTELWLKHLPRLLDGYGSVAPITSEEQTAFPLTVPFFLLVLLDHYQEHGPEKYAAEMLDNTWWTYNNLDRIRTAVQKACA